MALPAKKLEQNYYEELPASPVEKMALKKAEGIWTYEDLLRLPEDPLYDYEIIDGVLKMSPKPIPKHQWIAKKLLRILDDFVTKNDLGVVLYEVDVKFSDKRVLSPDIVFVSRERLKIIGEKCLEGAPDLVIEVASPTTREYDLVHKRDVYEEEGVKEYLFVDYERKLVHHFVRDEEGFLSRVRREKVKLSVLSGLEIDLSFLHEKCPW